MTTVRLNRLRIHDSGPEDDDDSDDDDDTGKDDDSALIVSVSAPSRSPTPVAPFWAMPGSQAESSSWIDSDPKMKQHGK